MLAKLYCYAVGPIDIWPGVIPARQRELVLRLVHEQMDLEQEENALVGRALDSLEKAAQNAFHQLGWEGDTRQGPFFFALPDPENLAMRLGYVLKQDNNGETFIASPFPLPWIDGNQLWAGDVLEVEYNEDGT